MARVESVDIRACETARNCVLGFLLTLPAGDVGDLPVRLESGCKTRCFEELCCGDSGIALAPNPMVYGVEA